MKIEKKAWPDYFEKVLSGEKNFDVRLANFECNPGDTLVLREWNPKRQTYTGRTIEKTVTFVLKTSDLEFFTDEDIKRYGYQILALK